ncbi:hypothetical protein V5799_028148 [Amblyomma americanum]|uniref:Uncharacterized protein n=1 Tax=Amblyomma americanum TaxID=6943 RepID=A0AAQ4DDP6_AMBAM
MRSADKEMADLSPPPPPPTPPPAPQEPPEPAPAMPRPATLPAMSAGGRFHRVLIHQEPPPPPPTITTPTATVAATNLASCVRLATGPAHEEQEIEPATYVGTDAYARNTRCLRFDLRF